MNKNNINKIKLFFMGLTNRFNENKDFFIELSFVFKSGLKNFRGLYKEIDGKYIYSFNAVKKEVSFNDVLVEILNEAKAHEEVTINYDERGHRVEIVANEKEVKLSNKELSQNTLLSSSNKTNSSSKTKENKNDATHSLINETSTLLNRNYYVNHVKAKKLLQEIDILTKDGKVKNDKIRKYNQIDHYIEVLDKDLERFKGQNIHIVDCGCGKSYLSFVLNYYLTEVKKIKCSFTGIDISEKVIQSSKKMAENLGYKNMTFIAADIKELKVNKKPNIVLSLHACDTATDLALSFGIKNNADLIVAVPCCHAEMNKKFTYSPFKSILKQGILKRRIADALTDGLRTLLLEANGYKVSIFEYISPLETPKNLMIKAYLTNHKNSKSEDEFMALMMDFNYAPALYRYLNDLDIENLDCEIDTDDDDEF